MASQIIKQVNEWHKQFHLTITLKILYLCRIDPGVFWSETDRWVNGI